MVEDLRTLAKINALVDSMEQAPTAREPRKVVPFLAIAPPARATLAQLASQVFQDKRHPWRGGARMLRDAELRLLGRVLGGDGPRRGDLFSYLYFDQQFIEASIALGQRDAQAVFDGSPGGQVPWRTGLRQPVAPLSGGSDARV
jgi:NTE family protein